MGLASQKGDIQVGIPGNSRKNTSPLFPRKWELEKTTAESMVVVSHPFWRRQKLGPARPRCQEMKDMNNKILAAMDEAKVLCSLLVTLWIQESRTS